VKVAREEHEPTLLEAVSFRFRGHSVIDPDRYRDQEEVRRGRANNDPIAKFTALLLDAGLLDQQRIKDITDQVEREVDEAVQFAEESPLPSVDTLFDYVYAPDDVTAGVE
jgi:pyruvate dehydrogenase E1 component alpha subunit